MKVENDAYHPGYVISAMERIGSKLVQYVVS